MSCPIQPRLIPAIGCVPSAGEPMSGDVRGWRKRRREAPDTPAPLDAWPPAAGGGMFGNRQGTRYDEVRHAAPECAVRAIAESAGSTVQAMNPRRPSSGHSGQTRGAGPHPLIPPIPSSRLGDKLEIRSNSAGTRLERNIRWMSNGGLG
jgi:hypothetical protein